MKIRPCDCKDITTAQQQLETQGIGINEDSITVIPNYVELKMGHTTIKIGMDKFKTFAEWYLTPQEKTQRKQNIEIETIRAWYKNNEHLTGNQIKQELLKFPPEIM